MFRDLTRTDYLHQPDPNPETESRLSLECLTQAAFQVEHQSQRLKQEVQNSC